MLFRSSGVGGKVTQQVMQQIPTPPTKGLPVGSTGVLLLGLQRFDLRSRNGGSFPRTVQQQDQKSEIMGFEKIDTARYIVSQIPNYLISGIKNYVLVVCVK